MKKQRVEEHHIKHLKRHRNFLYGIVMVLLVLQIFSWVSIVSQISKINARESVIEENLNEYFNELDGKIGGVKKESQFNINEITKEITQQGKDIRGELALLKASKDDFSEIIEDVVKKVVNVRTDISGGTGFFVNDGGYIITNSHIIEEGSFIQIQTFEGNTYEAELVLTDEVADLALLQIQADFPYLMLADSDKVQVGEKVIAIGNPLGLSFTVTQGIVSAVNRVGPNGLKSYIQTDVTLNPGNSGGPLINREGKVIGINNFKISDAESLGFALEGNEIREKINALANEIIID